MPTRRVSIPTLRLAAIKGPVPAVASRVRSLKSSTPKSRPCRSTPRFQGVPNQLNHLVFAVSGQLESWWPNARIAHAGFGLHQLDELHKVKCGVETEQGQEPLIKFAGSIDLSIRCQVE